MKTILIAVPTIQYMDVETFESIFYQDIPEGYSTYFKTLKQFQSYMNIDWTQELQRVKNCGINIYSVQCLNWGNKPDIKHFFKTMKTNQN